MAVMGVVGSGGLAWGGARAALNGTKARVTKIDNTLDEHVAEDHVVQLETVQRLASIETKLDLLLQERE
jgi:hypothetical protein